MIHLQYVYDYLHERKERKEFRKNLDGAIKTLESDISEDCYSQEQGLSGYLTDKDIDKLRKNATKRVLSHDLMQAFYNGTLKETSKDIITHFYRTQGRKVEEIISRIYKAQGKTTDEIIKRMNKKLR
jgi:hypothetical protein